MQSKSFPYVTKDEKDILFSVTVIGLFDWKCSGNNKAEHHSKRLCWIIPSYKIDYSQLINKNHVDSVLTYYAYKGTDSIQDKIVTFSFDIKKKLLMLLQWQSIFYYKA